jgi:glycosyltransferase involved in cell wall biosynthesis
MTPSLAITVPVYQEAENIENMIRQLEACVSVPHQLAIVYDREDDNTLPVVRELMREFPNISLLRNCHGSGVGVVNAIKTGFYETRSDYVCLVTGDCTDQPDAIVPMFELALSGNDLVSGTRYRKGGRKIGGPWVQTQLSRWGNWWFGKLTGLPIGDPTYSFKLYSRRLLDAVTIETEGGWAISFELSIKAHLAGFQMGEVGTRWLDRQLGESKFRLAGWLPEYLKWFAWGCWKINLRRCRGPRREEGEGE